MTKNSMSLVPKNKHFLKISTCKINLISSKLKIFLCVENMGAQIVEFLKQKLLIGWIAIKKATYILDNDCKITNSNSRVS